MAPGLYGSDAKELSVRHEEKSSNPACLTNASQITRCSHFFLKMEMWISGWQSLVRMESLPAFAWHLVWNFLLVAAWALSKECWKFIGRASATRVASAPCEFLPSPVQKTHGVLPFWVYVCVLCGLLGYFGTSFITLTSSLEFCCSAWRILDFTGVLFRLQIRQNLPGRQEMEFTICLGSPLIVLGPLISSLGAHLLLDSCHSHKSPTTWLFIHIASFSPCSLIRQQFREAGDRSKPYPCAGCCAVSVAACLTSHFDGKQILFWAVFFKSSCGFSCKSWWWFVFLINLVPSFITELQVEVEEEGVGWSSVLWYAWSVMLVWGCRDPPAPSWCEHLFIFFVGDGWMQLMIS